MKAVIPSWEMSINTVSSASLKTLKMKGKTLINRTCRCYKTIQWFKKKTKPVGIRVAGLVLISDRRYEAVATTWYLILAGNYR